MQTRRPRWARLGLLVALIVGVFASPALAQSNKDDEPFYEPGIAFAATEKPWIQWLVAAGFAMGCLMLAFKNPHRSHLD